MSRRFHEEQNQHRLNHVDTSISIIGTNIGIYLQKYTLLAHLFLFSLISIRYLTSNIFFIK
ncbi:hypothetical protein Hanom_Chr14g01248521 [Helianthus anomalus]